MKRVFLIVLDSFGIGALPDAEKFGDKGANTLASCATSPKLHIPNMRLLGLGNIEGVTIGTEAAPVGAYGRMAEKSMGKDTTIGHWEIAGILSENPLPPIPTAFPRRFWSPLEKQPAEACWPMPPGPVRQS